MGKPGPRPLHRFPADALLGHVCSVRAAFECAGISTGGRDGLLRMPRALPPDRRPDRHLRRGGGEVSERDNCRSSDFEAWMVEEHDRLVGLADSDVPALLEAALRYMRAAEEPLTDKGYSTLIGGLMEYGAILEKNKDDFSLRWMMIGLADLNVALIARLHRMAGCLK